jgi:hypothetical protein
MDPFALFLEDRNGPLWRQNCRDLEEAKRKGQELADSEGLPCFIFSYHDCRELSRFEPQVSHGRPN